MKHLLSYAYQIIRIFIFAILEVGSFFMVCLMFLFIGGAAAYLISGIVISIVTGLTLEAMYDTNYIYISYSSIILGGLIAIYFSLKSAVRTSVDISEGRKIGIKLIYERFKEDSHTLKEISKLKTIRLRNLLAEYLDPNQHKDLSPDTRSNMIDAIKMKIEDPSMSLQLKKVDQDRTETDLETGKKT